MHSLLTKESARVIIRNIMHKDQELSEHDRLQLRDAIDDFEKVALPFSPHEVKDSCRHSEIKPALEKLSLNA